MVFKFDPNKLPKFEIAPPMPHLNADDEIRRDALLNELACQYGVPLWRLKGDPAPRSDHYTAPPQDKTDDAGGDRFEVKVSFPEHPQLDRVINFNEADDCSFEYQPEPSAPMGMQDANRPFTGHLDAPASPAPEFYCTATGLMRREPSPTAPLSADDKAANRALNLGYALARSFCSWGRFKL